MTERVEADRGSALAAGIARTSEHGVCRGDSFGRREQSGVGDADA
jgi:hypothetical protein